MRYAYNLCVIGLVMTLSLLTMYETVFRLAPPGETQCVKRDVPPHLIDEMGVWQCAGGPGNTMLGIVMSWAVVWGAAFGMKVYLDWRKTENHRRGIHLD